MVCLLRVKPAYYRKDVLECDLVDVSLDERPNFTALSYHWGPPRFDHQMVCNGKVTSITQSLNSVLKRHRQDNAGQKKQDLLWVDALCINQSDKLELNAQLLLMHRIYTEAAMVQIDLGDVDNSWYPGYDLLNKLCLGFRDGAEQAQR